MAMSWKNYGLIGLFGGYVNNAVGYTSMLNEFKAFLRRHRQPAAPPSQLADYLHTLRREGNNHLRFLNPHMLSDMSEINNSQTYNNIKNYVRYYNMPEEASWFYVNYIRVPVQADQNRGSMEYYAEQGHPVEMQNDLINVYDTNQNWSNTNLLSGVIGMRSDKIIETEYEGRTVKGRGLDLIIYPEQDHWIHRHYDFTRYRSKNLFGRTASVSTVAAGYYPTFTHHFGYSDITANIARNREKVSTEAVMGTSIIQQDKETNRDNVPVTIELSFYDRILTTGNYLNMRNVYSMVGFRDTQTAKRYYNDGFDYSEITDNRFDNESAYYNSMFITLNMEQTNDLQKPLYTRDNFIYPGSPRAWEEYLKEHGNYEQAARRANLLTMGIEAAGLVNPFTAGATALSLLTNMPDIYFSYIDRDATQRDMSRIMPGYEIPTRLGRYVIMRSGETMKLTAPTFKLYKDKEKARNLNNTYIDLPVNKLFKGMVEFMNWIWDEHPNLTTQQSRWSPRTAYDYSLALLNRGVYIDIEPFMEMEPYNQVWDYYGKNRMTQLD